LEQRLLVRGKNVEASRDHTLDRLRHVAHVPGLRDHSRELLRVERIAARLSQQGLLYFGV